MQTRSKTVSGLLVRVAWIFSWIYCLNSARGQDYITPSDVMLPPEAASQEALDESAAKASLRFGLDFFPRAAVNVIYDDNILISSTNNPLSDVRWTLLPGFAIAAGDLSLFLSGPVTLAEIRSLLNYSLLDDMLPAAAVCGSGLRSGD